MCSKATMQCDILLLHLEKRRIAYNNVLFGHISFDKEDYFYRKKKKQTRKEHEQQERYSSDLLRSSER